MTNNTDTIAERIIDLQYDDEVYDAASLRAFLDASLPIYLIPEDLDNPRDALIAAISDDLKDLLHNGEEIIDDDLDIRLHDDLDYRIEICSLIADKLLARIA